MSIATNPAERRDGIRVDSTIERYRQVRETTESLCEGLSPEDCTVQSMPDCSPAKWHLAHTSWFFETMILESYEPDFRPFLPEIRVLFNSYYNTVGAQHPRPKRGLLTRPTLETVLEYRHDVDRRMIRTLRAAAGSAGAAIAELVALGLHHEQQHQELLLMDIKHLFSCNPLRPAFRRRGAEPAAGSPLHWHRHQGGRVAIGHRGEGFAFDNEAPRHEVLLRPFEFASRPVTNGEYQAFIEDDGYRRPELWLADGFSRVNEEGWTAPGYWIDKDDERWLFGLGGTKPLEAEEPVSHLSFYEADAYARWAGARLPSEAEWETIAAEVEPSAEDNFLESEILHPRPTAEATNSPAGLFGDLWEWTSSPYLAYPGFEPRTGALGEYNGKFMCNQFVLRGGCCLTPRAHVRRTYRNFYYPHQRWQFSGLRLARDAD